MFPTGLSELQRAALSTSDSIARLYYVPETGLLYGWSFGGHQTKFSNLSDLTQQTDLQAGTIRDIRYSTVKSKFYMPVSTDVDTVTIKEIDPSTWTVSSTPINATITGQGNAKGLEFDGTYMYVATDTGFLHRYRLSDWGLQSTIDFTALTPSIAATQIVRSDGTYLFVAQNSRNDVDPCYIIRINQSSFSIEDYQPISTMSWITPVINFRGDYLWIGKERDHPDPGGTIGRVKKSDLSASIIAPGWTTTLGECWGVYQNTKIDYMFASFLQSNHFNVIHPDTLETRVLDATFNGPMSIVPDPSGNLYVSYNGTAFISKFALTYEIPPLSFGEDLTWEFV